MQVRVFFTSNFEDKLSGYAAVVIDALRMTSVAATAIANGCAGLLPVEEISDAVRIARDQDALLGGERDALRIEGFDFSNSPCEYTREKIAGKRLVITTSNGTRAVAKAIAAKRVLLGAFVNASAAAAALRGEERVALICAGTEGQFTLEDALAAGCILRRLLDGGVGVTSRGEALSGASQVCENKQKNKFDDVLTEMPPTDTSSICKKMDSLGTIDVLTDMYPIDISPTDAASLAASHVNERKSDPEHDDAVLSVASIDMSPADAAPLVAPLVCERKRNLDHDDAVQSDVSIDMSPTDAAPLVASLVCERKRNLEHDDAELSYASINMLSTDASFIHEKMDNPEPDVELDDAARASLMLYDWIVSKEAASKETVINEAISKGALRNETVSIDAVANDARLLRTSANRAAQLHKILQQTKHYRYLLTLGLADDLNDCLLEDSVAAVPERGKDGWFA